MSANLITLFRVALAFVTIALYTQPHPAPAIALVLTIIVIAMDGLDGWWARRRGITSEMGAVLDITGDRIVENAYWIFYAATGWISFWVPLIVLARGFLTDALRSVAYGEGESAWSMMRGPVARFLVASRFMRGLYGVLKALAYCWLGGLIALRAASEAGAPWVGEPVEDVLVTTADYLVWVVVAICVIRGAPVLWEGRHRLLGMREEAAGS